MRKLFMRLGVTSAGNSEKSRSNERIEWAGFCECVHTITGTRREPREISGVNVKAVERMRRRNRKPPANRGYCLWLRPASIR